MSPVPPLPRSFYARRVGDVARDLLGATLVRLFDGGAPGASPARLAGRIVEVEAYDGPRDLACHASRGRTPRTDVMFGEAGHAYVYLIYGMHACLNVVTGPLDYPAAVLIRALEPLEGIDLMDPGASARRRGAEDRADLSRIASGPGRLTRALLIDVAHNRADLCVPGALTIEPGPPPARGAIVRGARIGVDYAGRWAKKRWRFGVRGSRAVSVPFPA